MTKFQLAVKVIVNNIKEELENYDEIDNWDDMLHAFGFDSTDMREEIEYYLESYSDEKNIDLSLTIDHELVDENGNFITYRQITNAVRKQLFN